MNPTAAEKISLDNTLVAPEARLTISKCSSRISFSKPQREATYQFWNTVNKVQDSSSYQFNLENKRFRVNSEVFRNIETLPELVVDHMHQPWRTFAAVINRCLSGKTTRLDNLRLCIPDRQSLLKGKHALSLYYLRFTKAIIHHFLTKDKSISMRNKTFMHTARVDSLLGAMRIVSRHEDTQVYGALLPKEMNNQAMLDSDSYKTYYAIAIRAETLKPKKTQKKYDLAILFKETSSKKKPAKAKKDVPSTKKQATNPNPTKKKTPIKADRGNGLNVLSEVALFEAAQLKEATKQSKKYFHISHASGSGDGTNFESGVLDEQQCKISGTDEGTEENDDDEDDSKDESDDDKGNDDDGDNDGNNDDSDHERTESDIDENPNLNQSSEEHEEEEEEYENEEEKDDAEELYRDVNVNLKKEDVEMTYADQGGADQHNVSQVLGFEHVEEDAHVTLTVVHDTQNTEGPMQVMIIPEITSSFTITIHLPPPSFNPLPQQATPTPTPTASEVTTSFPALSYFSYVFRFNDRVTNLEKDVSEMNQFDKYAQAISSIPAIVNRYIDNKLGEAIQQAIKSHIAKCREEALADKSEYIDLTNTSVRAIIKAEVKTQLPHILTQVVSDFATPVIERNVTESLEVVFLAKSSSQPKSTYVVAASLSEFELTKILMNKMEEHKSYLRADYKKELYDALVKSYNTNKDLFETYGEIFTLKRSRDDKVKDQDPSAGSDRETKKGKSSKEAESSRDPRSKEKFDTGNNDKQPDDEAASKIDWFKKPEQPPTPDPGWNKRQHVDFKPPQTWISNIAHVENLIRHSMSSWILPSTSLHLISSKEVYSRKRIIAVTSLKIRKWYDYGHFDKIKVRIEDQELYKFKEGDFPRLRLQDIEDMLLLLVQHRLTNLTMDERYDLNVVLCMFTRRIVIQMRVEDLQLGVESYQKKLNLTKPDTFRSDLRNITAYTAYSDPQGVIYKDRNNRNRLMHTYELHKFSDGTLNYVWTALHDITSGIRMEYLPKRKWGSLDKRMARVMIQDIDKQLFQRRLMRNLEKFAGGREYGEDLRLLEWTI
ncbi:hypothetical protein Tco_0299033 [Tanacetum coccineum]